MFKTEEVVVIAPTETYDELGDVADSTETRTPVQCLVAPGATVDLDTTRPEGVTVAYTVHFPKTFTDSLRGCSVEVRGAVYTVIGDPQAYAEGNTPGGFDRAVEVTRTDG